MVSESDPQRPITRCSNIIRKPSELTSGIACSVASPYFAFMYRYVKRSITSDSNAATTRATTIPTTHLPLAPTTLVSAMSKSAPKPPCMIAHIIIAETIKSAGIVKLRKLSTPIMSVKATETIT